MNKSFHVIGVISVAAVMLLLTTLLFLFDPEKHDFYPRCPFHTLSGLYCPGCGSLRAMHHLLHRDFITAIGFNALTVVALAIFAGVFVYKFLRRSSAGRLPSFYIRAPWDWLLLGTTTVFWIIRNIPVAPLSWLAP